MPTSNTYHFPQMNVSLLKTLFCLFESAQKFAVRKYRGRRFPNELRTRIFARRLNAQLGFPTSTSKFEYFHFVLTRNTILQKHINRMNDARPGYNFCVVYSFFQQVEELEYRVSVIMTVRNTVGVAFDRFLTQLN